MQGSVKLCHQKKKARMLLELDLAKAFDTVSWPFLIEVLQHREFGSPWREWIALLLSSASTRILLNGQGGSCRAVGVRQGDPGGGGAAEGTCRLLSRPQYHFCQFVDGENYLYYFIMEPCQLRGKKLHLDALHFSDCYKFCILHCSTSAVLLSLLCNYWMTWVIRVPNSATVHAKLLYPNIASGCNNAESIRQ